MNAQATFQTTDYEETLVTVARTLPPGRLEQLVDFARFLEAQSLEDELALEESAEEVEADNARWDALLATEAAQVFLEKLADEALAEHRAGKTKPMVFTQEGRIAPG